MSYKPKWRLTEGDVWLFEIPLAVIGTVQESNFNKYETHKFYWCTRVIYESLGPSKNTPQGYATSLEGAKKIVETICLYTGTTYCMKGEKE